VRTLRNAFAAGRIAHAWMLTGVRGVGKTTTARILARGLNYATQDGEGAPTVDLPAEEGVHCRAILEGRHPDVVEMDAASHTGIDDIRDIIDSARYSPVSARYKVYVVDEVHMLSRQAFNGLLKTLEEPPAHVKFVFATTEVRRVPVTVLSRCQRFDLRRIEAGRLIEHLAWVAGEEEVEAEPEALRLVARAAEGSVRDALSVMDQAIAHGGGAIAAATVQDMLGLADRARTIDLFEQLMRGDTPAALAELKSQHDAGADPLVVLTDLAEFCHLVARLKLAPAAAADAALSESERVRGQALAEALSVRVLSRAWQMLFAGIQETAQAPRPLAAADMVLVRLCHASELPTPDEAVRMLQGEAMRAQPAAAPAPAAAPSAGSAPARARGQAAPAAAPREVAPPAADNAPQPRSFEDVVALARARRDRPLVFALERHVRPIRFEEGRLEIAVSQDADAGLAQQLMQALTEWTGRRWVVAVGRAAAGRTLHEERQARQAELMASVRADPLVESVLTRFPGAEIVAVREIEEAPEAEPEAPSEDDEVPAWLDEAPPPDTFDAEPPEEDD
jgi:DNA polymerase III subunit gamma/tau